MRSLPVARRPTRLFRSMTTRSAVAEDAVEAATPAAAEAPSEQAYNTSSRRSSQLHITRVGNDTDAYKTASYMYKLLTDDPECTVCLQCVGASCFTALRALASLQDRVLKYGPEGTCVTFKPQRRLTEGQQDPESDRPSRMSLLLYYVQLGPTEEWPAEALQSPPAPSSSQADSRDRRSRSSSGTRPMVIRRDGDEDRVKAHAVHSGTNDRPATFLVAGGRADAAASAKLLHKALSLARFEALKGQTPFDLQCTLTSSSYTPNIKRREQEDPESVSPRDDVEDMVLGAPPPADADDDSEGSPSEERRVLTRRRYMITVVRSAPSRKALERAARQQQQQEQPHRESQQRGPYRPRPGFVEVAEEEWNQLKEQLEAVPHLTEQLQIMTRQHEQLLSLLAAQQQQQAAQEEQPSQA